MVENIMLINTVTKKTINMDKETTEDYILDTVEWGPVESNRNSYKYVGQIGVSVTNVSLETRSVTISGWIYAESDLQMTNRKADINAFFNPQEAIEMRYSKYSLRFIPDTTVRYSAAYKENNEIICKFKIDGLCADPLFHETETTAVAAANIVPKFRFPFMIPGTDFSPKQPDGVVVRYSQYFDGAQMTENMVVGTQYRGTYPIGQVPDGVPNLYDGTQNFYMDWVNKEYWQVIVNNRTINSVKFGIARRSSLGYGMYQRIPCKAGETYVFTGQVYSYTGSIKILTDDNGVVNTMQNDVTISVPIKSYSPFIHAIGVIQDGYICVRVEVATEGDQIAICQLKLEKGSSPTVWAKSQNDLFVWKKIMTMYSPNPDGTGLTEEIQPDSMYIGRGYLPPEVVDNPNLILNSDFSKGMQNWIVKNGTASVVDGVCDMFSTSDSSIHRLEYTGDNPFLKVSEGGYIYYSVKLEGDPAYNNVVYMGQELDVSQWSLGVPATPTVYNGYMQHLTGNSTNFGIQIARSGRMKIREVAVYKNNKSGYVPALIDWQYTKSNFEWVKFRGNKIILGYKQPSLVMNVVNSGTVSTGLKIVFKAKGEVVNPSITNIYNQKFIKINKTMQADEEIVIDTVSGEKKVVGKIGSTEYNYFKYRDLDSSWLQVEVGSNLFRYDADNKIENLEVYIYFSNKYLEVQECY